MDDAERFALGLKDLPEALHLRNHILSCFEAAAREEDELERRPWTTFVVVGGGPTGVEYAGALSEHESVAIAIERSRGLGRFVVVRAQCG